MRVFYKEYKDEVTSIYDEPILATTLLNNDVRNAINTTHEVIGYQIIDKKSHILVKWTVLERGE